MTVWFFLLILFVLIGLGLSIAFFFRDKQVGAGSWMLGSLAFLQTIVLLEFAMLWTRQLHHIPHFVGLSYALPFLFGPFAWAYVKQNTREDFRFTGTFLFHLIPFFWLLFLQFGLYVDYTYSKEIFIKEQIYTGNFFTHPRHMWITIFQVFSMMCYSFLLLYEAYQGSSRLLFRRGLTHVTAKMKKFGSRFAIWTILFALSLITVSAGPILHNVAIVTHLLLAAYVFGLLGSKLRGQKETELQTVELEKNN